MLDGRVLGVSQVEYKPKERGGLACLRPWATCRRYCSTTASAASRLCPSLKNSRQGFYEEQRHSRLPQQQPRSGSCEFRHTATRARVCPKQNCWSAFTGWGTTSARAKVALGWRGASWAKLSLLTSCFDPKGGCVFFHNPILRRPPTSTSLARGSFTMS